MRLHLPAAALLLTTAALAQAPKPDALTQWRAAYAAGLAQPDGWLALVPSNDFSTATSSSCPTPPRTSASNSIQRPLPI